MKAAFKYSPEQRVTYRVGDGDPITSVITFCATYYGEPFYLLENGETIAESQILKRSKTKSRAETAVELLRRDCQQVAIHLLTSCPKYYRKLARVKKRKGTRAWKLSPRGWGVHLKIASTPRPSRSFIMDSFNKAYGTDK